MEEILSNMNFDPGMAIPIANEENKRLESQVVIIFCALTFFSTNFICIFLHSLN